VDENILLRWAATVGPREIAKRIATLEEQLKQAKDGWDSCIADLREAGRICKETEDKLKALDWTPITDKNLPKVGDQVFDSGSYCAALVIEENKDTDWIGCGFDLFRPVNLPHAGVSTGDAGTDGGKDD